MKINCGEDIKRQRMISGLTQSELAKRLGVSYRTVYSWECNRTEPKMEMIEKMCKIFDCKKSDIVKVKRDVPDYDLFQLQLIDMVKDIKDPAEQRMILRIMPYILKLIGYKDLENQLQTLADNPKL